ncbi:glycosyl transferase family 2 [Roseivirga sp. 4D4]|uniref:glycosyltransferase family 2 protein n=1 Tax=Roseivirga sp. 4D4 TaxID=1889784 RepID=UPI000853DE51|nr:glycosyltransferase family 2 protein [Roseivirga sp. 4D4]OEK01787.1 glycosyl transferase family 2 [Roseivirga sp. 4D4]
MERLNVTAIIPTFNEEQNIAKAIESVLWANEIIVIDSFSTDRTLEIAGEYNVQLVQHEYVNSATQKNWIIPQAKNEWIFLLDADEYATDGLIEEVRTLLKSQVKEVAYWINRKNFFMGIRVNYSGWQNDKVIRLFKRDFCKYEDKHVHAEILADGPVGHLKNVIEHNTYKGLSHYLAKIDRYSTWKAYDKLGKGASTSLFFNSVIKPIYRFVYHYFLRLGILDGRVGFVISALNAYDVMLRGVKIWRIKQGEKIQK